MYQRILAPVDGSRASDLGVREAVALARDQHAALRFLHVIDERLSDLDDRQDSISRHAMLLKRGNEVLDRARRLADKRDVACETALRERLERRVADRIVAEARDWPCDLIVMGTHGSRGLRNLVIGSDAQAVLCGSPVPVLLVRGQE